MSAVLEQRLRLKYTKQMEWVTKELTLQQRQLSPLAQAGTLRAYAMDSQDILLPKAWALANLQRLGLSVDKVQDNQFTGEPVQCELQVEQLRPHQAEALEAICTQFHSNPLGGGALLVLDCGMGKSVTALAVAAKMKSKCLIVTHTAVLAKQWSEAIMQYCPSASIGQIVQNKYEVNGCTHVIGSLQSLAKREYDLQSAGFSLCVFDEAHHTSAVCMSEAINNAGCRYRLGLSATPLRPDGLSPFLEWAFGPIAYEKKRPPSDELKVYMVKLDEGPITTMVVKGPKQATNISGMVNLLLKHTPRAKARQQVCFDWIKLAASKDRKILVIGDRVQLLKHLEKIVKRTLNVETGFLIGSSKPAEREAAKLAQVIFGSYGTYLLYIQLYVQSYSF